MFIVLESDGEEHNHGGTQNHMHLQRCRNVNWEKVCVHFTTNAICFLMSPSCFTERDDNQDVSLKSYPLKKSKVWFPSYCRVQERDSPPALNLLINPWKQESWEPQLPSQMLLNTVSVLNPLLGTSSELYVLLRKRRTNFRLVLALGDKNLFSHERWQTVLLLLKLYWNSDPWADLQISCFETELYC